MKTIPQSELRSRMSSVLRRVQAGERVRITIAGQPVAELVPVGESRPTFLPRETVAALLQRLPVDPTFARDLAILDADIDEL